MRSGGEGRASYSPSQRCARKESLLMGKIASHHRDIFIFHFWKKGQNNSSDFKCNFLTVPLVQEGSGCFSIG